MLATIGAAHLEERTDPRRRRGYLVCESVAIIAEAAGSLVPAGERDHVAGEDISIEKTALVNFLPAEPAEHGRLPGARCTR